MRALATAVLTMLALAGPAAGAPHKVLVLPVDGTADAATRTKLTAEIARLAKGLDGQVATASATFADTALAVGCDPQAPSCRDEVMATLGVDELVWGTATGDAGQAQLVVQRAARGRPVRDISTVIAASDSTERIDAGIAPLFGAAASAPAATPGSAAMPAPWTIAERAPAPDKPAPVTPPEFTAERTDVPRDRHVGVVLAVAGGVALAAGIALWASYSNTQDSIDRHATVTRADFDDLTALEDRANTYAITGDLLVIAGLAAGGAGAYYLYQDHRRRVAITPALNPHGGALVLTILGGP